MQLPTGNLYRPEWHGVPRRRVQQRPTSRGNGEGHGACIGIRLEVMLESETLGQATVAAPAAIIVIFSHFCIVMLSPVSSTVVAINCRAGSRYDAGNEANSSLSTCSLLRWDTFTT